MERQASNEYLAKTTNGFVAVAMGVGLLLAAGVMVMRAPSGVTVALSGLAGLAALWFLVGLCWGATLSRAVPAVM